MMTCVQRHYRRLLQRRALAFTLVSFATVFSASATTFSGNATLDSDYIWRGSSQTLGKPAIQAGLKAALDSGLYGAWSGSSVNFGPAVNASSELDLIAGWNHDLSQDWNYDINLTHYLYPGSSKPLNWTELGMMLSWQNTVWLQTAVSNQVFATSYTGRFVQLGARYPFNDTVRFEIAVEHYVLPRRYAHDYSDALASVIWSLNKTITVRLSGHHADNGAKRLFPGQASSRLDLALQASF